jgi:two-component system OmpR family sensor kinase
MTFSLRARLTIFYAAMFGLLALAMSIVAYRVLADQLDADASTALLRLTTGLHGYLNFDADQPRLEYDESDADQAAFVHDATRYYQIYDAASGTLLLQSDAMEPLGLRFTPEEVRAFRERPGFHDVETDYGRIRLSSSLMTPGKDRTYLLQVGASLESMDRALSRFFQLLFWTVPASVVLMVFAGRWLAGVALHPLSRLAAATRHIGVANLRERLPIRGSRDQLDEVAHAFNEVLARLEDAVGEMRQFSTALAHELRTPLTALRGEIEMALLRTHSSDEHRMSLISQLEEIDRLKRLIDQLLTLARAEAGEIPLKREVVDLSALTSSVIDQLEPIAVSKAIDLRADVSSLIIVEESDAEWLRRLLLNLLDNALKFTPEGGSVLVRLAARDGQAALEVADSGPGMEPSVAERVFEPFYRADESRSHRTEGAGLGLSLVKWIVERHRGRIDVHSEPGRGSTFTVELPLSP